MGSRILALVMGLAVVVTVAVSPVGAEGAEYSEATQTALAYFAQEYSAEDLAEVRVTDEYTSDHNGVTHVYLRQQLDGEDVTGANANANVRDGQVLFAGSRFIHDLRENASGEVQLDVRQAAAAALQALEADHDEVLQAPRLEHVVVDADTVRRAYNVQVVTDAHWWNVHVDAEDGTLLSREDWIDSENAAHVAASTARHEHAHAVEEVLAEEIAAVAPPEQVIDGSSYRVYPLPMESPLDGGRHTVHNPADAAASPYGWHDTDGQPGPEHTMSRGNNVNAYADTIGVRSPTAAGGEPLAGGNEADPGSQPDGGEGLDFDHPIVSFDLTPATYRDAAVDNLFYMNNVMHDVTFRYGFDEQAGNFQETNYTGEGVGGDAVNAEAQDGTYTIGSTSPPVLNANFATPADGSPGRMQMYLWVDAFRTLGLRTDDIARPYSHQVRDGDLDNGVIAHEYGHGISNRLVGGPSNVSCLRTHDEREGEGWSDWWSYVMTMRPGDDGRTPRGIGNYVVYYDEGRIGPGIRITPYSTDMRINPSTYTTISTAAEPHGVGYVWASMLWDLYWNLVDQHGFNPNVYDSWETGGNNLALQLVMDGMKFSVCEPGFVDARDAIIAADAALTAPGNSAAKGENECLIWSTFARRGLGVSAEQGDPASKTDGVEGYDVPAHCNTPPHSG